MTPRRPIGFRSLLCPVDFSEHSRTALRYAAAIALRGDAALTVAYVNDPLLIAAASTALHDQHMAERSLTELREFADATIPRAARNKIKVSCRTSIGNPSDEILKTAAQCRCDLIALGTHGLMGANRWLIGSTTLHVLQRTTVPVLAVPPRARRSSRLLSRAPDRIAAAVDLGPGSRRDVENAARIAQWFGRSLLLIHVVDRMVAPKFLLSDLNALQASRIANATRRLEALAEKARGYVDIDTRVASGRPAEKIAAVAARERIGLLITALREKRGWFGLGRGVVSYHLLSHAATPVLACPPAWRPR